MENRQTLKESTCAHCGSENTVKDFYDFDGENAFHYILCKDCHKKSHDQYLVEYQPREF